MRRMEETMEYAEVPGHGRALCIGRFSAAERFFVVWSYRTHSYYVVDRTGRRAPREVPQPEDAFSTKALRVAAIANETGAAFARFFRFPPGTRVAYLGEEGHPEGVVAERGVLPEDGWMPVGTSVPVRWDDGEADGWYAPSELTVLESVEDHLGRSSSPA